MFKFLERLFIIANAESLRKFEGNVDISKIVESNNQDDKSRVLILSSLIVIAIISIIGFAVLNNKSKNKGKEE